MKKIIFSTLATLTFLSGCDQGTHDQVSKETPEFETYDAETFFLTTSYGSTRPSGLAYSPDAKYMLANSDQSGVYNAYQIDLQSKAKTPLTSSTTDAIFAVSYFPKDSRILYTFDGGGNELNHLWVREESGDVKDLTPGEKVKAFFDGWSSDYQHFYAQTNEIDGKAFDLYRYDATTYERELVYRNKEVFDISALSNDGRYLALVRSRTSADSNIYLLDLKSESAKPELITPHDGNIAYGVYGFSPDNKLIFSTNEFGEYTEAWSYDLVSKEKKPEFKDDWNVSYVAYSKTGKYRVTGVNADAQIQVKVTEVQTGKTLELPALPPGQIGSIRFAMDDRQMAFSVNGDRSPTNLFTHEIGSKQITQLTDSLNPKINPQNLVESKVVRYKSFDGLEIPSILYKPVQADKTNKVPALVFVHGGPGGQSTKGYRPLFQHLANHGYAVLAVNNRGSSGYGKTFFHLDDKRHGEEDLKDVVWGRKYLEQQDWVQGDKVGIIGGSYGGFMTAAALAFHPEAFDVGINIFGVTNWVRTLKSIPPWWESFREALYDEMGDPATDEERHRKISPLFHAKNIVKPLLVVQGANDPRVLQVESDELVAAVRGNNVPVEYVLFSDEGHGFRKRENRVAASKAYVKFLDTYLKSETIAQSN